MDRMIRLSDNPRHRLAVSTLALATALTFAGPFAVHPAAANADGTTETGQTEAPDPRAGDPQFEEASRLLRAIDSILEDVAEGRSEQRKLPSNDDFLVTPIWTETKEDREDHIRELLDSALGIVTDVPIVEMQDNIEAKRRNMRELDDQIVELRERQLGAPTDSLLPGILADTVDSLESEIVDLKDRITRNEQEILAGKSEIYAALSKSGIEMPREQLDLLLDSVLSNDLVKLVATFNAAKLIDQQLGERVKVTEDNTAAARKYFAMHAALFAMLVHSQDTLIKKIDREYLPKLSAISRDLQRTRRETRELLKGRNRPDQQRALQANLDSQAFSAEVAEYYRAYLLQQREQLAAARIKAEQDLRIADNTFETVEASFQLRALIKDAASSFEAIQRLEAPGFDQIFKDEDLRREFENLTEKLAPGS